MGLPKKVEYVIIGAGVHGLSTAYHLARMLKAKGMGRGEDVLVVEKSSIAAGASGVACGNVRCNYYQEPMTRLMMHCMDIWESDPDYFAYNSVGYLTASFAPMREGLEAVHERHQQLGYPSTLVVGEREVHKYMQNIFHDWQAENLEVLLHEHRGGHAWSRQAIHGLAIKAEREDARILIGPAVTGFQLNTHDSVSVVETDFGDIETGRVIVAVGPWIKQHFRKGRSRLTHTSTSPMTASGLRSFTWIAMCHCMARTAVWFGMNPGVFISNATSIRCRAGRCRGMLGRSAR